MKNKQGFTLIELLAVIVILAVVALIAVNAILPQMTKARKGSFITEIETYKNAADTYYTDALMKETPPDGCTSSCCVVNIKDDLNGTYVKKDNDNYKGYIKMEVGTDNKVTYTIKISNGQYTYGVATGADQSGKNIEDSDISQSTDDASTTALTCS